MRLNYYLFVICTIIIALCSIYQFIQNNKEGFVDPNQIYDINDINKMTLLSHYDTDHKEYYY